jgi:uncharacterized protein YidB (DUF937 family)
MDKRKIVAGAAVALAVGITGAAIAATKHGNSPRNESKAVISDAAKQLGIEPAKLSSALKKAVEDRIDAAVAAGRLTKAQGAELKQRIESNGFPLVAPPFGGPFDGPGHGHFGDHGLHGLDAAASYLGLSEDALRAKLESGKTLAQVAKDQGKSVEGLVAALKADLRQHLDRAVADGHLTQAEEDQILAQADQRLTDLVNGKFPGPPPGRPGLFRHAPDHAGFTFGGNDA